MAKLLRRINLHMMYLQFAICSSSTHNISTLCPHNKEPVAMEISRKVWFTTFQAHYVLYLKLCEFSKFRSVSTRWNFDKSGTLQTTLIMTEPLTKNILFTYGFWCCICNPSFVCSPREVSPIQKMYAYSIMYYKREHRV